MRSGVEGATNAFAENFPRGEVIRHSIVTLKDGTLKQLLVGEKLPDDVDPNGHWNTFASKPEADAIIRERVERPVDGRVLLGKARGPFKQRPRPVYYSLNDRDREKLQALLSSLPPELREVFEWVLSHGKQDGFGENEIADALGIPNDNISRAKFSASVDFDLGRALENVDPPDGFSKYAIYNRGRGRDREFYIGVMRTEDPSG